MSELSIPNLPSAVIDMRKDNNLTIITEEGIEYQAKVYWQDVQLDVERDFDPYVVEGWVERIPRSTTYTIKLVAISHGPVTCVQR